MINNDVEKVNCALCHGSNYRLLGAITFEEMHLGFVKCLDCGLAYANPRISKERANKYFQNYRKVNKSLVDLWAIIKAPIIRQELKLLKKYSKIGKFLDIGCAYGFLLNECRKLGWDPYGIEISEPNVLFARQEFGLEIFHGLLNEANFQKNSFNVITINDTLYYSYNLIEDLLEMRRVLKEGGVLLIRDSNRIDYIIIWQYIKKLFRLGHSIEKNIFFASGMRDHLFLFNPRSLKNILN